MKTCKLYYCSCKYLPKFSDVKDMIPLNPSAVCLCMFSLMDGLFILILYSESNNKKEKFTKETNCSQTSHQNNITQFYLFYFVPTSWKGPTDTKIW